MQYEFNQVQIRKLKRHLGLGEKKPEECPCRCQCPPSRTPMEVSKESVVVQIEPPDEERLPPATRTPRHWTTERKKEVFPHYPDWAIPMRDLGESDPERGDPFCVNCHRSKRSDTAHSPFSDDCPELQRYAQWRLVCLQPFPDTDKRSAP